MQTAQLLLKHTSRSKELLLSAETACLGQREKISCISLSELLQDGCGSAGG
jgi:hypothetical protein